MSSETISVSTLKEILDSEYERNNALYKQCVQEGDYRNANCYTDRLIAIVDIANLIEEKAGVAVLDFDDEEVQS